MLLKVLVYGYIYNIYSNRKIEEAVSLNINFMWLTYDEYNNQYICPIGEPMKHIDWTIEETKYGYPRVIDKYKASNCEGCFCMEPVIGRKMIA